MAEANETIDGPQGERWNKWLVQDQQEILDITNPKLQTHLRLLARRDDGMNTPDYLQEVHKNLEKMVVSPEDNITLEDVTPWMIKIEERHKFLIEQEKLRTRIITFESAKAIGVAIAGENTIDLPDQESEQRLLVRSMLRAIEKSGRDCYDYSNVQQTRKLEVSLDNMHPAVAEEVRTRLSIHDSSELIRQAAGFLERRDGGATVSSALSEAQRRGHDINQRTVEIFFKEGLPDLRLADAWNLLEDANFDYPKFVLEVNDSILRQIYEPGRFNRRDYIKITSLLKKGNYDSGNILKKEQSGKYTDDSKTNGLASGEKEFIVDVLSEGNLKKLHSIYGFELSDSEKELGKVPTNYFADSNVPRKEAVTKLILDKLGGGKNALESLQIAEKMAIATFETSVWNKSALSGNDELAEIIGLREYRKRRRVVGRNGGPDIHVDDVQGFGTSWIRLQTDSWKPDNSKPVYADNIDPSKVTNGSHQVFGPAYANRYQALRNLLMDRAPKPEFNNTFLQNAIPYFNTADGGKKIEGTDKNYKCGDLNLRVWWVAGVVDMALSHINVGWGQSDVDDFRVAVSVQVLSPDVGTFITPEQWDWIERAIENYQGKLRDLTMKPYYSSLIASGGSGSRKR